MIDEVIFCFLPEPIYPKFFHLRTTRVFRLDFQTKASENLINQILTNRSVMNLSSALGEVIHPLNFSVQIDNQTNQDLLIEFTTDKNLSKGTEIKLLIEKKEWMIEKYPTQLMIFEYTLILDEDLVICSHLKYYDPGIF